MRFSVILPKQKQTTISTKNELARHMVFSMRTQNSLNLMGYLRWGISPPPKSPADSFGGNRIVELDIILQFYWIGWSEWHCNTIVHQYTTTFERTYSYNRLCRGSLFLDSAIENHRLTLGFGHNGTCCLDRRGNESGYRGFSSTIKGVSGALVRASFIVGGVGMRNVNLTSF